MVLLLLLLFIHDVHVTKIPLNENENLAVNKTINNLLARVEAEQTISVNEHISTMRQYCYVVQKYVIIVLEVLVCV